VKLPQRPPTQDNLLARIEPRRLPDLFAAASAVQLQDRYLHWNELRRRPAPPGLSHDEWWFLLKLGRSGRLRPLPLRDKSERPFWFGLPDRLLAQLHAIDRGLGTNWDLPEAVTHPSSRDKYVVGTLIREAITSSQLEGAATTREVAKDMLRTGRPPRDKSERMILNNFVTMQHIMEVRNEPLSPELVFDLHRRVSDLTLDDPTAAGRFRRTDERIRVTDMEGTVFHDPPLATELGDRMTAMCAFANGQTPDTFVHPVIRAIILHFWLAYDHPFVDGNGRTARALFYWAMLHQAIPLFEFISISQVLLRAPAKYALAFLHAETDDNDLTYFILHQAEAIQSAVDALREYAMRKTASLWETERSLRLAGDLNHRQQALISHALRNRDAVYTIEGHRRSHGVVYQTARTDLLGLAERGLLMQSAHRKPLTFRVPEDLKTRLTQAAPSVSKAESASPLADNNVTLPLEDPVIRTRQV
jgi:Fic family protein